MKKLSRGAYEDTKGTVRVLETLTEVIVLSLVYYFVWRYAYSSSQFMYKGKFVLIGVYAVLALLLFEHSDCTNSDSSTEQILR